MWLSACVNECVCQQESTMCECVCVGECMHVGECVCVGECMHVGECVRVCHYFSFIKMQLVPLTDEKICKLK